MAMQYQLSSEIHAEGLRTLYPMNPNFLGYSDSNPNPQSNLLNPAAAGHALTSFLTPHAPLTHDPGRLPEGIAAVHDLWFDHSSSSNMWVLQQGPSLSLPRDHQISRFFPGESPKSSTAGVNMENEIIGSKYVKAAQELLEEMVSVLGRDAKDDRSEGARGKAKMVIAKTEDVVTGFGERQGCNRGGGDELTTAQRQEVLMKKAKLCSMLEEVDERRKQYHRRMQLIVSSFEQFAGIGSAREYTEVALRTILRQFGRLRAAMLRQIKDLNKSLGVEEEEVKMGSRLRMVDRQIKQQSALEQAELMMMPKTTWRPQRGLPQRAVAVLRAWLFDHFLHPYPKDSDKHMLARKTGLTRSQVSNWFINARVRLWKPMVEAMYAEETNNKHKQHVHTPSHPDTILGPSSKTMSHCVNPPKKPCHDTISPLATTKPHQPPITTTNPAAAGPLLFDTVFGAGGICQLQATSSTRTTGFQENGFSLTLGLPCLETSPAGDRPESRLMAASIRSFGGGSNNVQGNSQVIDAGYAQILDFQNRRKIATTFQLQPQLLPDFYGLTG